MSKFLSLSGLRKVFSEMRAYVDNRTPFYFTSPAMEAYLDPDERDYPLYNKNALELRAHNNDSKSRYFPITTIDSILNESGNQLWLAEFESKLAEMVSESMSDKMDVKLRLYRYNHTYNDAFRHNGVIKVTSYSFGDMPDSIADRIRYLFGEINRPAEKPGQWHMTISLYEDGFHWYISRIENAFDRELTIFSEDFEENDKTKAANAFGPAPLFEINGKIFSVDKYGVFPHGTLILDDSILWGSYGEGEENESGGETLIPDYFFSSHSGGSYSRVVDDAFVNKFMQADNIMIFVGDGVFSVNAPIAMREFYKESKEYRLYSTPIKFPGYEPVSEPSRVLEFYCRQVNDNGTWLLTVYIHD